VSADDHLNETQWPRVGDKFAHRDWNISGSPAARAAMASDPDNPKHYEKAVVTQVHGGGAITYKSLPYGRNSVKKTGRPEEFQRIAIPWGNRMDPRKLGYPNWQGD
jgi:hypothetical protein